MSSLLYNIGRCHHKCTCVHVSLLTMFTIGALHSQVGSKDGRHSEQDMKESLTHFQYAAGAYQYFYVCASCTYPLVTFSHTPLL